MQARRQSNQCGKRARAEQEGRSPVRVPELQPDVENKSKAK